MMMMKITFMTTLRWNVGDEFIRAGIQAILREAGIKYTPLYVCKHVLTTLFYPVEDETVLVGDKFWDTDLFIQAGAPVFWRNADNTSSLNAAWHRYLWEDRILQDKKPFFNLGAGSCLAWGQQAQTFTGDGACFNFAKQVLHAARLTTVRDRVALDIANAVAPGQAHALACPALFAATRFDHVNKTPGLIGVNLMSLGCHHDLDGGFDQPAWRVFCWDLVQRLRRDGHLVFIAHDHAEFNFMRQFAVAGERVYWSDNWREYAELYGTCQKVVANRVHGAVCAAGFGTPAVILGNDTRALIGEYAGVPVLRSGHVTVEQVVQALEKCDPFNILKRHEGDFHTYVRLVQQCL